MKTEIKGFNLSTDYALLWDLIHKGYRIPAWMLFMFDWLMIVFWAIAILGFLGTLVANLIFH